MLRVRWLEPGGERGGPVSGVWGDDPSIHFKPLNSRGRGSRCLAGLMTPAVGTCGPDMDAVSLLYSSVPLSYACHVKKRKAEGPAGPPSLSPPVFCILSCAWLVLFAPQRLLFECGLISSRLWSALAVRLLVTPLSLPLSPPP